MANPNLEGDIAADAMGRLVRAAQELNDAADAFREDVGLSVGFYVNVAAHGDRIGVHIEGELIDACAKPARPAIPTKDGEA